MKIAVVDDLRSDADRLIGYIGEYEEKHRLVFEKPVFYESGEAFLDGFSEGSYEIVFLDIYMSGMNGFETAKRLRDADKSCAVIFITTSAEFAVESYEVGAAHYLLKPVTAEKVFAALDRCGAENMELDSFITVRTKNEPVRLYLHRISYTEYTNRRIIVHLKNGSTQTLSMNHGDLVELVRPYDWLCDCIKGMTVNFEDVEKLMPDRFIMRSGVPVPISRLKYHEVREKYLNYTYSKMREESWI